MRHPLDRNVASDLSYESFQLRRRRLELTTPQLDSQNRRLYGLPSQMVVREAFMADRANIPDSYQGESIRFWPVEGK